MQKVHSISMSVIAVLGLVKKKMKENKQWTPEHHYPREMMFMIAVSADTTIIHVDPFTG